MKSGAFAPRLEILPPAQRSPEEREILVGAVDSIRNRPIPVIELLSRKLGGGT